MNSGSTADRTLAKAERVAAEPKVAPLAAFKVREKQPRSVPVNPARALIFFNLKKKRDCSLERAAFLKLNIFYLFKLNLLFLK